MTDELTFEGVQASYAFRLRTWCKSRISGLLAAIQGALDDSTTDHFNDWLEMRVFVASLMSGYLFCHSPILNAIINIRHLRDHPTLRRVSARGCTSTKPAESAADC